MNKIGILEQDRVIFITKYELIIWFAIIRHIVWGFFMLFSDHIDEVTGIYIIYSLLPNRIACGSFLIITGILAIIGLYLQKGISILGIGWFGLQQFILILSAVGVMRAILLQRYSSGYVPPDPQLYIFADDGVNHIVLAFLHMFALFKLFFYIPANKWLFK